MTSLDLPLASHVLVLAAADDPSIADITGIAIAAGRVPQVVHAVGEGLGVCCRRPSGPALPCLAIICGTVSRLAPALIVKALRGLPGMGRLPVVIIDMDRPEVAPPFRFLPRPLVAEELASTLVDAPERWGGLPIQGPAVAPTGRPRILVVDDHAVNRAIISRLVRSLGYDAETADGGRAALARSSGGGIAAILLDDQMPDLDGYSTAAAIRAQAPAAVPRVPIIGLAAPGRDDERARCLTAGMDDCLAKPVSRPKLLLALSRWCGPGRMDALPAALASDASIWPADASAVCDPAILRLIDREEPGSAVPILDLFLVDLGQTAADAGSLAEAGALVPLAALAHRLKGAAGSLGALEIHRTSTDLEHAARAGDRERSAALVPAFTEAAARFKSWAESVLSRCGTPTRRLMR